MKYLVLAIVLFIAGLALTQLPRDSQTFTPLVRVRTTNGLFMTFVEKQTSKRGACDEAIELIVAEFGKQCPNCSVESTECATSLEGVDRALAQREQVPLYVVASDELRIGLLGPPESVKARCEGMASMMLGAGVKSAACIPPGAS